MAPEEEPGPRRPEYNVYRSRRRAEAAPEEEPKRRSLIDLILRAGAVATAIGSIVAVVTLLWPDSESPATLRAKLSNVAVETNVTLADFSLRRRQAIDRAPAPDGLVLARRASIPIGGATAVRASATLAQEPDQAPPAEESSPEPPATDPQDPGTEQQPDEPPAGERPDTPEQDSGGPSSKAEEKIDDDFDTGACDFGASGPTSLVVPSRASLANAAEVADGHTPLVGVADDPCGDIEEGLGGGGASRGATEGEARAQALLKVLRGTRTRPSEDGRLAPVGVTVSFDAALEGFSGRQADVRWSLYDARGAGRVPRDWLVNRRAVQLTDESASDDFWVPLPKLRGPFFVRIGVYDGRSRLTFRDSRRFR